MYVHIDKNGQTNYNTACENYVSVKYEGERSFGIKCEIEFLAKN